MTPHIATVLSGQNGDLVGHISRRLWQKNHFQCCTILCSENADN